MQMDSKYQHPSIQLFIMGLKPPAVTAEKADNAVSKEKLDNKTQGIDQQVNEVETSKIDPDKEETRGSSSTVDDLDGEIIEENCLPLLTRLPDGKLNDWEARRYGSIAARLLRDINIT